MDISNDKRGHQAFPRWVAVLAGVLAIAALVGLFALESFLKGKPWAIYAIAFPAYVLLQIFGEGVLEGFWASNRWLGRIFTLGVLAAFYTAWFTRGG